MGSFFLPLLRHELRAMRRSFLGWTIASSLLLTIAMSAFHSIAESAVDMNKMIESLPAGLKAAFNLGQLDLNTPLGYYAGRAFLTINLLGGLFSALLGAGILAKEEGDGTADFLLSKPISRASVVGQKLGAVVLGVLAHYTVLGLVSVGCFAVFTKAMPFQLIPLLLGATAAALAFAMVGLLASAAARRARGALPLVLAGVLGAYFLGTLSGASAEFRWLRWISFFQYVDAIEIVKQGLNLWKFSFLLVVAGLAGALAFPVYTRKDVAA